MSNLRINPSPLFFGNMSWSPELTQANFIGKVSFKKQSRFLDKIAGPATAVTGLSRFGHKFACTEVEDYDDSYDKVSRFADRERKDLFNNRRRFSMRGVKVNNPDYKLNRLIVRSVHPGFFRSDRDEFRKIVQSTLHHYRGIRFNGKTFSEETVNKVTDKFLDFIDTPEMWLPLFSTPLYFIDEEKPSVRNRLAHWGKKKPFYEIVDSDFSVIFNDRWASKRS